MIELKNIDKSFKNVEIFKNMNVEFESGVINYIKGINGSGKSVLLKLIVGYSMPQKGTIIIDDKILHTDCDFILDAGISINSPEFLPSLTGLDNLLEIASIRNVIGKSDILKWVDMFDMNEHINKKYSSYSLGMKQKLRLIQAFMENPRYLILDEPFDGLDKKSVQSLKNILKEFILDNSKYIIITCHNTIIEDFVDVIYEIDEYKINKINN